MSNTPKLRFKEFSGDWESKKLGDISKIYDGTHQTPKYTDSGVKFVSVENINNIYEGNKYISEEDYSKNFKVKPQLNDIFMTRITAGEIGATAIVDREENLAYYVSVALIRAYNEKVNSLFLTKYIASKYFKKELNKRIIHVAFPKKINLGDIGDCGVNLPKLEEQEKIASFFSLIDDKISLQGQKVEALKDYKRGMMQKIFSRELRFKDDEGRDYPEWEEKKLGELIKVKSNRNKNSVVDLVLSVSNTKGFITQSEQFEDRVVASSDISNYKIVEKNDFAFNPARINVGSIARLKLYDRGIISPMYICFKCLDLLDNDYLEYFLMTHSFDVQMKKKLEGSVRQTLSAEALGEIVIGLPCLDEQKKIGKFLNSINNKIEKEQEKLDSLNEYKKGLLQQMFV